MLDAQSSSYFQMKCSLQSSQIQKYKNIKENTIKKSCDCSNRRVNILMRVQTLSLSLIKYEKDIRIRIFIAIYCSILHIDQMFRINDRFQHLLLTGSACQGSLSYSTQLIIITVCCLFGIAWAVVQILSVEKIDVIKDIGPDGIPPRNSLSIEQRRFLVYIGDKISSGAKSFLKEEYLICLIFVFLMMLVIGFTTQYHWWTAVAFVIGALVSILCGIIGMIMATRTNYKVTYCAVSGMAGAFKTAYRAGCVMGFALVSLGLLVLTFVIFLYKIMMNKPDFSANSTQYLMLFESVAGYGLGGSFVALFGRVGGGIYTKAADVGADLVGKVEAGLPEDSPRNPATIADNVGDNVGDVAGMSADLFGSFAESTCAALVLSSNTLVGIGCDFYISNLFYPLLLIAFGIVVCLLVSTLAIFCMKVNEYSQIETTLKVQLLVSTIILVGIIYLTAILVYPSNFEIRIPAHVIANRLPIHPFLCSIFGLVSGLIIAGFTEYMTSHSYKPVRDLSRACISGAGANITLGLALGYLSTVVPALLIAITAYFANLFLGFYGVALAALGMLANLPISLAIDGYGPISDNAGGIAEMGELGHDVRAITDALDAAGNTTAAIGKGFAIGSAVLVSLSLYGGFLHNAGLSFSTLISLTQPEIFTGLMIGAMLPYLFSAFTIKSVGDAAQGMVQEVRNQIRKYPGILNGTQEPDYDACIRISTQASLKEMIAPGLLVILTPLFLGFVFGPLLVTGFLPGAIVSAAMLATSAANTGGAWDNAKKYIESQGVEDEYHVWHRKGSEVHKAAVIGDTVGDPLKDTSGPALNILMKLMAIISLVFGNTFTVLHPIV